MQPGARDFKWQPFQEPLRVTVARTSTIALLVGAVLARWLGGLALWPIATALVLWPTFGGHWVELWFLNFLRPRLPVTCAAQAGVRIGVWFIGGIGLAIGMRLTALSLPRLRSAHWPAGWLGGLAFIGVELAVHLVLQLCGRPSFYNGRG